jgi:hypothetical protein
MKNIYSSKAEIDVSDTKPKAMETALAQMQRPFLF